MTCLRKRFVQRWERQSKNAVQLPAAFCFMPDGENQWRCYYGHVGKVRRSRVFINRSAIYGFVSARELEQRGAPVATAPPDMSHNRFIRCKIIDRIKKPWFVPSVESAVSDVPAASPGMAAADASGAEAISLI